MKRLRESNERGTDTSGNGNQTLCDERYFDILGSGSVNITLQDLTALFSP